MSGGALWGFSDFDRIRNLVPDGDAVLQWQVHEEINAARDWLEAQGAKLTPLQEYPHLGRIDRHMDPPQAIESLTKKFQQLGGQLFPEHAMESLMTSANGTVCGVRVVNNGHIKEIRAPAVILATGGFQGNAELLSRYIVRNPGNVTLRANPWSTGDGFLAATAIGGAASAGLHTFYGHCMVAPPARVTPDDFRDVTQWYSQRSIAVNLYGQRFTDETAGTTDQNVNQSLAHQPRGLGFLIIDEVMMQSPAVDGRPLQTKAIIDRSRKIGAVILQDDSIAGLCRQLATHYGLPEKALFKEIEHFNRCIEAGEAGELVPPRSRLRSALLKAPFYAIPVKASITFTMGGLQVDERARVLRRAGGSSSHAPVPPSRGMVEAETLTLRIDGEYRHTAIEGLYAAGTDVGNICNWNYIGGLGPSLVFGRIAGRNAAAFANQMTR